MKQDRKRLSKQPWERSYIKKEAHAILEDIKELEKKKVRVLEFPVSSILLLKKGIAISTLKRLCQAVLK